MKAERRGMFTPKMLKRIAFMATIILVMLAIQPQDAYSQSVTISKVANPTTAIPGQTVSWTITLQSATQLNTPYRLTDTFPNGFIFNQAASTIPPGTFSYDAGLNSIVHEGTVAGNASHQFIFVGTVNPNFSTPGTLNNTATMFFTAAGVTLPSIQASASIAVIRTSITGFKYNDQNGNGAFNAGEPRLAGWTITSTRTTTTSWIPAKPAP